MRGLFLSRGVAAATPYLEIGGGEIDLAVLSPEIQESLGFAGPRDALAIEHGQTLFQSVNNAVVPFEVVDEASFWTRTPFAQPVVARAQFTSTFDQHYF